MTRMAKTGFRVWGFSLMLVVFWYARGIAEEISYPELNYDVELGARTSFAVSLDNAGNFEYQWLTKFGQEDWAWQAPWSENRVYEFFPKKAGIYNFHLNIREKKTKLKREGKYLGSLMALEKKVGTRTSGGTLYEPSKLKLGENYSAHSVLIEKVRSEFFFPVSITKISSNKCVIANYRDLLLLDLESNSARVLIPPKLDTVWMPTGVFFNSSQNYLYIANYKGSNILVCRIQEDGSLKLLRQITHSSMRGPENIAVSKDGNYVAIADYDSSALLLFYKNALLWQKKIPLAHGVGFSSNDSEVYISGLTAPFLSHFDLSGTELSKVHHSIGWGKDKYLYPTTIAMSEDGSLIVDARSGQLSLFDKDNLEELFSIGGMGSGTTLFNLPYGVTWDKKNVALVADTANGRIVRVDIRNREILDSWYLNSGMEPMKQKKYLGNVDLSHDIQLTDEQLLNTNSTHSFSKGSESLLNNYRNIESEYPPLGKSSFRALNFKNGKIVDTSSSVDLSAMVPQDMNYRWFKDVYGFVTSDSELRFLANQLSPFFCRDYIQYFFAHDFVMNGKKVLLLSSPAISEVFIIFDGLCVTLPIYYGSWVNGGKIVSHHGEYTIGEIVQQALSLIETFQDAIQHDVNRIEVVRETFFPNWEEEKFFDSLKHTFVSKAGREFFSNFQLVKGRKSGKELKKQYLDTCFLQKTILMGEYFFVSLLTYEESSIIPNSVIPAKGGI